MITEAKKETQCKILKKTLMKGYKITSLYVAKKFGIVSLHPRLTELRRPPYNLDIVGEWHNTADGRYKRYYLK